MYQLFVFACVHSPRKVPCNRLKDDGMTSSMVGVILRTAAGSCYQNMGATKCSSTVWKPPFILESIHNLPQPVSFGQTNELYVGFE